MLNGIDPIIIFQFAKKVEDEIEDTIENELTELQEITPMPVVATDEQKEWLPPIPIYLSEQVTGLYIDSTNKNIDVDTSIETTRDGGGPVYSQKGVNSSVTINMIGISDSIGLTLILAMADLIFKKVTSRDYRVFFFYKGVTIFNGLLHGFSVNQSSDNNLFNITLELSTGKVQTQEPSPIPVVGRVTGEVPTLN